MKQSLIFTSVSAIMLVSTASQANVDHIRQAYNYLAESEPMLVTERLPHGPSSSSTALQG